MKNNSCELIFNAIKSDNLIVFSQLVNKNNLNISFGRFPILSLCYLYNAKKIIKQYQPKLCNLSEYDIKQENFEIYKKFSTFARRCLRIYLQPNSIVSPLEMLAILNKDNKIKQYYRIKSILKRLYKINNALKIWHENKKRWDKDNLI